MCNITVYVKSLDGFSHMSDITWIMRYKISLCIPCKRDIWGKKQKCLTIRKLFRTKKKISWTDAVSKEWLLLTVILHNNAIIVSRLDIGYGEQRVVKKKKKDCRFFGVRCRNNNVPFPEKNSDGGRNNWGKVERT